MTSSCQRLTQPAAHATDACVPSTPPSLAAALLERVGRVQEELQALKEGAHALKELEEHLQQRQSGAPSEEVAAELAKTRQENMELASRLAEAEEMNSAMMSMYVSSYQLHATLDPERVVRIIMEVVINFVGGEEFAVLLRDEDGDDFEVAGGEGHEGRYGNGKAPAQGVLGAVVASGEPFVHPEEAPPRDGILAAVPLGVGGRVIGAVVLFKLLQQKSRLVQADVELLHLLSAHAATALFNARTHTRMERKLRTLEGLMGMLDDKGSGADLPG